jgi:SSS family solute:Na+ symporter
VDTPVSLHLPGFAEGYATGSFLWIVNNIYFQYYSVFIFVVSVVVMVAVSYATAPPAPEQVAGLTHATVATEDRALSRASWSAREVIASGIVLLLILAVYLYFRG